MQVIIVGASHGVPEFNRSCASIFIRANNNTYVIDAGADVSYMLTHYGFTHESLKSIFITHPHTDHIDGLVPLCDQLMWFYGFDTCVPKIFIPKKNIETAIKTWMEIIMPDGPFRRESVDFEVYKEGVIFDDGVLKATAIRTKHLPENSYSFKIECEGKTLFFTGDLGYGFTEYLDILGDTEYDLVVCEGAHHNPGTVNEMLKETPTKHLVINHLNPEREVELKKLVGNTTFKCEIAYDGMTIEL